MPIQEFRRRLCFVRLELLPGEIPDLLIRHSKKYPDAQLCETAGRALLKSDFEPNASKEFVRQICEWGGGHRNVGRIESSADLISNALSEGVALVREGKVAEGVARVRRLHYLGQSFASKQLRFLEPSRAVVFDSVIRRHLGYRETTAGYSEFLNDCHTILDSVRNSGQLDKTQAAVLRVCDIEAAIFAKLQGY